MGTKCAPSYANIFMGWFEEKFIFRLLTNFINDIFLIWNGTKIEFDNFLKKINECYPIIKLRTNVYVKPTYRQSHLHSKSVHPILIPLRKVLPIAWQ